MWAWLDRRNGYLLGVGPTPSLARRRAGLLSLETWVSTGCGGPAREFVAPDVEAGEAVELVGDPIAIGRLLSRSNCEAQAWLTVAEVGAARVARAS